MSQQYRDKEKLKYKNFRSILNIVRNVRERLKRMLKDLRRHMMMQQGGGGHNLSAEYQEVEYIENTAGSWLRIDSPVNYVITNFMEYTIDFEGTPNVQISNYPTLISCNDWNANILCRRSGGSAASLWASAVRIYDNSTYYPCDFYTRNTIYVKGTLSGSTTNQQTIVNGRPYNKSGSAYTTVKQKIELFRWGVSDFEFRGKMYYVYVSLDDVYKYELIPCYRKADNVAGMYDILNDVFYTNRGSGTFVVGSNI